MGVQKIEKCILVVDDSPTLRMVVTQLLRNLEIPVLEAVDGKDALDKLQIIDKTGQSLSLIVTDINMPEMDGITLIRKVRESQFKFTPILVLSSERDESTIAEGISAGASGWLQKPFRSEDLLNAIKSLVWLR